MKRLFKTGLVTTVLGVIMVLGATYLYLFEKDTVRATELGAMALVFLRSKDSLIGLSTGE